MRNQEQIQSLWEAYLRLNPGQAGSGYEAWAFGDSPEMADELLALVLRGIKTGTSSSYAQYELEGEEPPQVGDHSILLDGQGQPKAIIVTTKAEIRPFQEVSADFAYTEGEGDRSLAYWRAGHQAFFSREGNSQGFDPAMLVLCENFKLVYPLPQSR